MSIPYIPDIVGWTDEPETLLYRKRAIDLQKRVVGVINLTGSVRRRARNMEVMALLSHLSMEYRQTLVQILRTLSKVDRKSQEKIVNTFCGTHHSKKSFAWKCYQRKYIVFFPRSPRYPQNSFRLLLQPG